MITESNYKSEWYLENNFEMNSNENTTYQNLVGYCESICLWEIYISKYLSILETLQNGQLSKFQEAKTIV